MPEYLYKGLTPCDQFDIKKEYNEIHKDLRDGCGIGNHGDTVISFKWAKTTVQLLCRTRQWLLNNPIVTSENERATRDIRRNNKDRLEYIVRMASNPYDQKEYEKCMQLLHSCLAEELIAMHHLDMAFQLNVESSNSVEVATSSRL
ncbi:Protein CBG27874 [Caenorhabditis briggsae]|nr:Protein CBG27874 [Caenorhabditis briggsae]ULT83496.1 hypothetical protein L3Y34_012613 [Caenorhabditis briggsae]CAR98299.1 Protein CBG27874 [Caenorhabditis briggsae]